MEKIQVFSDKIEDEIHDAEEYARLALSCKEKDPVSAEVFYKISNEEIGHVSLLHTRVMAIIEAYRKEHGDPPRDMQRIYDILHKKHIESLAAVKGLLSLYK